MINAHTTFDILIIYYVKLHRDEKESHHKFLFEIIEVAVDDSKKYKVKEIFEIYSKENKKVKGLTTKMNVLVNNKNLSSGHKPRSSLKPQTSERSNLISLEEARSRTSTITFTPANKPIRNSLDFNAILQLPHIDMITNQSSDIKPTKALKLNLDNLNSPEKEKLEINKDLEKANKSMTDNEICDIFGIKMTEVYYLYNLQCRNKEIESIKSTRHQVKHRITLISYDSDEGEEVHDRKRKTHSKEIVSGYFEIDEDKNDHNLVLTNRSDVADDELVFFILIQDTCLSYQDKST